jgi:hypothetical protein
MAENEYIFRQYEDFSIEKEEFTLYGLTITRLQETIHEAIKKGKNFLVITILKEG